MTESQVTFYFAYNSPYAFLANTRVAKMLGPLGVSILYKPVYRPRAAGAGPDMSAPRMRYIPEDIARFAEAYGLAFDMGPFADTGKACRGFLFADRAGEGRPYHDGVYAARWLEGKDIGDERILASIAVRSGLEENAFVDAIKEDGGYAQALEQCNAEAEADGVFGFPFFVYRGHKFWGNDRLEWLVREIEKER